MKTDENRRWQSVVIAEKEKSDRESVGNKKMYNAIKTAMNMYIPKLKPFNPFEDEIDNSYIMIDKLISKVIRLLDDEDVTLIEVRVGIEAYVNIHSDLLRLIRSGDITTTVLHPPVNQSKYFSEKILDGAINHFNYAGYKVH